jgi:hypothetical protein
VGDQEFSEHGVPSGEGRDTNSGRATPSNKQRFGLLRRSARGVGWLLTSPTEWLGFASIQAGASVLGRTYQGIRAPRSRDLRFKTKDSRAFDLVGTAFAYGISIEALERRLAMRRRQTTWLAYGLFGFGCLLVLAWVCVAVRTASHGSRVVLLLQFLPFYALFFLMSFYQALINFQIRTGRAANWREYVFAERDFLPRC